MVLNPQVLPPGRERRFVPSPVDMGDWTQGERFFKELENRRVGSKNDLEAWLKDYSELLGVLSEAGAMRYIRMTEQTDNESFRTDYLMFIERVAPMAKRAEFNLNRKFANSPFTRELPDAEYQMMKKRVQNRIVLFREENVELEKEDEKLGQQFEGITGAMTVQYEGRTRTMSEMGLYLEEQDRKKREDAWRLIQSRRLADESKLDGVYEEMVRIRSQIAKNAGFENYRDYSFLDRERFDYTPADCYRFHEAVEKHIVPLVRDVQKRRLEEMKLEELRPWDMAVDAEGRPPLKPFSSTEDLVRKGRDTLTKVDHIFGENFQMMVDLDLFDLASRPGKAPGGYNAELSDHMLPFTFMNAVGRDQDMWTLLHESGHAFHIFEMRGKQLPYLYRGDNLPSEMAEVASMSMELMASSHIEGTFYGAEDARRSIRDHLRSVSVLLPWIATIDAFQHWVYTHPGHTLSERREAWVRTDSRFNLGDNWTGLEDIRKSYWHRQLHIFLIPFYYFEYGVAQLGALGIWSRYKDNPKDTVEAYKSALSLGSSKPLPELFQKAGLPWDFGESVVEKCAADLRRELLA
ncbi:MAG: M3 family oligoendopeptidase [Nitrososphaerota archaeon]|nr:M3 family oligoendopeptidase [Nitrososphaerota archaeon]